jgi:acylphosphatase
MTTAVEVRITGLVQGVSFRAHTRQQAHRLHVVGWVRNDPDGSVVGHLEGPDDAVAALVAWCRRGPAYADVDTVEVTEADPTGVTGFTIR